jgi:hypothetical protein
MTIELPATHPAAAEFHEELIQFVFRSAVSSDLLQGAREMLGTAPKELAESFEQAVRTSGFAS